MRLTLKIILKMYYYRITKYNPKNRTVDWIYCWNEWTNYSDINKKVSLEEYLKIENKYLNFIIKLMNILEINNLKLVWYENWLDYEEIDNSIVSREFYNKITNNINLKNEDTDSVVRCILREYFWWKLIYGDGFFIHFWRDYYMYIWFNCEENVLLKILDININWLYLEKFKSPYLDN